MRTLKLTMKKPLSARGKTLKVTMKPTMSATMKPKRTLTLKSKGNNYASKYSQD